MHLIGHLYEDYNNAQSLELKATYVFAKYDAFVDKKMHINSLRKEEEWITVWILPTNYMESEAISDCRMASFHGRNSEIQGYILIVGEDFFFAPALKSDLVLTHPPGMGLAKLFEGACPNCL
jgi:hypothetical protein